MTTFEARVDCAACLIEGSRIELWDTGGAEGADDDQAEQKALLGARCLFCVHLPEASARSEDEVVAAFEAWGREEGLSGADELFEASFVETDGRAIVAAVMRGERVETTFDLADYLFSSGGGSGSAGASAAAPASRRAGAHELAARGYDARSNASRPPSSRASPSSRVVVMGGPREELLALAAVAAADGVASVDDRAVLDRAAASRGIPALGEDDLRVWRPTEIAAPPTFADRERVLEEMFRMAWADGELDQSELLVVRDFARAWGVDPEKVRQWIDDYSFESKSKVGRWFGRIGSFLFPAR